VVRAGTSKSGLHNKPAGCGATEAYASGPGSEEEEEEGEEPMDSFLSRSTVVQVFTYVFLAIPVSYYFQNCACLRGVNFTSDFSNKIF
jgi:hypothetical protein